MNDVTIIGGGIAGLTLSCLLAREGVALTCIDQADPKVISINDERTTAVSYGTRKVLERAGIWQHLEPVACPIRDIRILDDQSPLLLNFLSDEVEDKTFGWIVENKNIRAALYKEAAKHKNLIHLAPAKVTDFALIPPSLEGGGSGEGVRTFLKDGTIIDSQLIIGADGRGSFTRQWMDVPIRQWQYNQQAVICIVAHEKPHKNIAVEHFMPEGPFAVLPMQDDDKNRHRSSIVWTEHQGGRSLMDMSDAAFQAHLQSQFPKFYGEIEVISRRLAYPLNLIHAQDYIAPRMALVADAAHGIHPIAGQGLNLGFRDINEMANLLINAHQKGEDLGDTELLETYQRRRRPDNMAMVAVTDGLNRLFGNNNPLIRRARQFGLKAVERFKPAKRFFMKQAMADR